MERKIGEIFEYYGEWYQCIPIIDADGIINYCEGCAISASECDNFNCIDDERSDKELVIFKKLQKLGEPFACRNMSLGRYGVIVQRYKVFAEPILTDDSIRWCDSTNKTILIALDMEEKKIKLRQEDVDYIRRKFKEITQDYIIQGCDKEKVQFKFGKLFEPVQDVENEEKKLNLKPFDIQKAKEGKPVCTSDGRKARIICFDRNDLYPIVALIECEDGKEIIGAYSKEGRTDIYEIKGTDLMMLPEKKEGWAKVRKDINLYGTKEEADRKMIGNDEYVTAKVCWEE